MVLSQKEEKILKSIASGTPLDIWSVLLPIIVPSENDPNKPEFPPTKPKFPATPTYKIKVPGFFDVWLKDESVNPTGTHKGS